MFIDENALKIFSDSFKSYVLSKLPPEPITDLTGTSWIINNTTCPAGYGIFNVNYDHYNLEYGDWIMDLNTELGIGYDWTPNMHDWVAQADTICTFSSLYWVSVGDKIKFTGGTDVTNQDLINWLQENATQII